ncbi:MAG: hypothetical protein V4726_13525 [Verrucomicrobiota bacterium]
MISVSGGFAQQKEWKYHRTADGLHPSPIEQKMMWLMNRARANPAREGVWLSSTGDPSIGAAVSYLGVDMARMRSEFAAIPAAPPAAFDRRLHRGAELHSVYMISTDSQTHDGQGDLLNDSGFVWDTALLSVFAYCENAVHAHAALNIDYGDGAGSDGGMQQGRGHRVALMSDMPGQPVLSNVGLAMVEDHQTATEVGPYIFSASYASAWEEAPDSYNRFVVGTVWNDLNGNRMYDEGEGLGGVRVELDHGKYFAVTAAAGGFSIPVLEPGDYVATYSGGAFPGSFSARLEIGEVSVQADAEISSLPQTYIPPVVEAPAPLTAFLNVDSGSTLILSWTGGRPPYQVQRSRRLTDGWEDVGTPTEATSMTLPMDESAGFFRIRDSQ